MPQTRQIGLAAEVPVPQTRQIGLAAQVPAPQTRQIDYAAESASGRYASARSRPVRPSITSRTLAASACGANGFWMKLTVTSLDPWGRSA